MSDKINYKLLGGPLHGQTRRLKSRMVISNRYRNSQSVVPAEDKYQFYNKRSGPVASGEIVKEDVAIEPAIYRVETLQGRNEVIFPLLIYTKWDINDALEYLVFGSFKVTDVCSED